MRSGGRAGTAASARHSEWLRASLFADEWGFVAVSDFCVKGLASGTSSSTVTVSQTSSTAEINTSAALPLVLRKAPLAVAEIRRLGPETANVIFHTRELILRGRIEDTWKPLQEVAMDAVENGLGYRPEEADISKTGIRILPTVEHAVSIYNCCAFPF